MNSHTASWEQGSPARCLGTKKAALSDGLLLVDVT